MGGVLATAVWANYLWYFVPGYSKQDARSVVAAIASRWEPGDLVAIVPEYQRFPFEYYFRGQVPLLPLNAPDLERQDVQKELARARRVWWVFVGDHHLDPEGRARQFVTENYEIDAPFEVPNMEFHPIVGPATQVYPGRPKQEAPPGEPGSAPSRRRS